MPPDRPPVQPPDPGGGGVFKGMSACNGGVGGFFNPGVAAPMPFAVLNPAAATGTLRPDGGGGSFFNRGARSGASTTTAVCGGKTTTACHLAGGVFGGSGSFSGDGQYRSKRGVPAQSHSGASYRGGCTCQVYGGKTAASCHLYDVKTAAACHLYNYRTINAYDGKNSAACHLNDSKTTAACHLYDKIVNACSSYGLTPGASSGVFSGGRVCGGGFCSSFSGGRVGGFYSTFSSTSSGAFGGGRVSGGGFYSTLSFPCDGKTMDLRM